MVIFLVLIEMALLVLWDVYFVQKKVAEISREKEHYQLKNNLMKFLPK